MTERAEHKLSIPHIFFDPEELYDFEPDSWPQAQEVYHEEAEAPLIVVVGASGGVGRSSIALLMALLCAKSGIDTVLLEGDLQFGDIGFWLGLDDALPTLADEHLEAIRIHENLDLYKAPLFPEIAEDVNDALVAQLAHIRQNRGLVIADSGAFWSGFTADLLLESTSFLMVTDHRAASIAGAIKASELCARLGIPLMRMTAVYNRWSPRLPISAQGLRSALGSCDVLCIPDGKSAVEDLIGSGNVSELLESDNAMVQGVRELLTSVLPRVGILYADAPVKPKGGLLWRA